LDLALDLVQTFTNNSRKRSPHRYGLCNGSNSPNLSLAKTKELALASSFFIFLHLVLSIGAGSPPPR